MFGLYSCFPDPGRPVRQICSAHFLLFSIPAEPPGRFVRLIFFFSQSRPNCTPHLFGLFSSFPNPGRTARLICSAHFLLFPIVAEPHTTFVRLIFFFSRPRPNRPADFRYKSTSLARFCVTDARSCISEANSCVTKARSCFTETKSYGREIKKSDSRPSFHIFSDLQILHSPIPPPTTAPCRSGLHRPLSGLSDSSPYMHPQVLHPPSCRSRRSILLRKWFRSVRLKAEYPSLSA